MGAYDFTHAATHTGFVVELQGGDAGKVSKIFHKLAPRVLFIEVESRDDKDDQ
jgi:hypothetical protein